jgi:CheY-like chemotaxis protein
VNEYIEKDIENTISSQQEETLSSEKTMGKHDTSATNDNEINVDAETPERKPIKNILFVDDEESVRKVFKEALERLGYKTMTASDGNEGMALFRENPADLIITDLFMPAKDGYAFIFEIMQEFPGTKVFAITGKITTLGTETELEIAQTLGAIRGFIKPVKLSELLDAFKEL